MSFMQAQMTVKMDWYAIDGNCGTDFVPVEDVGDWTNVGDYTENSRVDSIEVIHGYGVRSSAPGYMDKTDWSVYTNLKAATKAYNQEKRECEGDDY